MEICVFQRWPKTGLLASFQTVRAPDVILVSAGQPTPLHSVGEATHADFNLFSGRGPVYFPDKGRRSREFNRILGRTCRILLGGAGERGRAGREIQLVGRLSFLQAFELQG